MTQKKPYIVLTVILMAAFFGAFLIGAFFVSRYFVSVGDETKVINETMVAIPYGSSLRKVSEIIAFAGVVDSAPKFYWYMRLGRLDGGKIQAGYYDFAGDVSKRLVAERLLSGKDQSFRVTYKEGQTLVDLVQVLTALELINKEDFITAMRSPEILGLIPFKDGHKRQSLENDMGGIEGYLFPDTYFFSKRDTAPDVIKKMYGRLLALLDETIIARMHEQGLGLHEVLTIASIIEKETGIKAERPVIASVYKNRMQKGMRLQADPTVIYGIKNYAGKISKADLKLLHPYNTYQIKGLPPGPIAAPGIDSIKAALWPAETKLLYFVSRNDGTHEFCETIACHNKAVKIWQIDYFKNLSKKSVQK